MATAVTATETLDQKRLLKVLSDYKRGDFSVRRPADRTGLAGKICDALNDAIERNEKLCRELVRLSNVNAGFHRHVRKPVIVDELIATLAELAASAQR